MLDYLNSIDLSVFRFINSSLSNPVLDFIMPFLTDLNRYKVVLAVVLALLLWMLIRGSRPVRLAALLLIISITISDQLSSSVIKFWFTRPRPCHVMQDIQLLVGCGGGYSFPSSHAVNNFAGALILAFFLPRAKWWFMGFAAVIAFSRVYVGVHYPSDVIGGTVIGLIIAGIVLSVFLLIENYFAKRKLNKSYS